MRLIPAWVPNLTRCLLCDALVRLKNTTSRSTGLGGPAMTGPSAELELVQS